MMLRVLNDLVGPLLTYMPMIIVAIIIVLINKKRSAIKTTATSNPTQPTLKRTSIYCFIDTAFIIFFTLADRLGFGGTNYGFGNWAGWGLMFAMFAAVPLSLLFIFDLVKYFKSTDPAARSEHLLAFAFAIFSILLLITTLILVISFTS